MDKLRVLTSKMVEVDDIMLAIFVSVVVVFAGLAMTRHSTHEKGVYEEPIIWEIDDNGELIPLRIVITKRPHNIELVKDF